LGQFALTRRAARDAEVPNFAAMLFGLPPGHDTAGIASADIASLIGDVEGRTGAPRETLTMTTLLGEEWQATDRFQFNVNMEPTPNPDSRVTLTSVLDPVGVPRVDLHWVFDSDDYDSMARGAAVFAREFGRTGMGRLNLQSAVGQQIKYGNHHMGTTRMHDNPRRGVVDRHGQVHGVRNLYMAGSSVFPAGGFSNPTITIVALALRLAGRIDRVLG
jgi:choline dehydrogenase-like flavoprotein